MKYNKELKLVLFSLVAVVIVCPIIYRFLPNWEGLVGDVGESGAWIVTIIYHTVYGLFVGAGTLASSLVLKKINRTNSLPLAVVAAILSAVFLDVLFIYIKANTIGFAGAVAILLAMSFTLNFVLSRKAV
ncbi:hypothetical protein SAMN02745165_03629 [Malonomonas rubra DSM 5091]|uniref:Uncharacterized protein n=1 Tax=Malonomonas rubra DSM 5091 TaxID=1122189 RepID=A0A1M6NK00_MALRU|nr:hypothetical protein [Malonomonas rubra]SHJ96065.1 hypothetical protein SAMN02745165_03629 [Malonomonas rubra DSM 5091]